LNVALRTVDLGMHHCGVEVLGEELFFAGEDSVCTGVHLMPTPRQHPVHVFQSAIYLGESELSAKEIQGVISEVCRSWPANSYHLLKRNCIDFAEEFVRKLEVPIPVPTWVAGVVRAQLPSVPSVSGVPFCSEIAAKANPCLEESFDTKGEHCIGEHNITISPKGQVSIPNAFTPRTPRPNAFTPRGSMFEGDDSGDAL